MGNIKWIFIINNLEQGRKEILSKKDKKQALVSLYNLDR